jgi:3-oxoadipate enol-lactonase
MVLFSGTRRFTDLLLPGVYSIGISSSTANFRTRTIHVKIADVEVLLNDLKLFYTDSGKPDAPAIIFIHGFPFDHTMWREQVSLCESSFRVITYDQRGHGKSGAGDGQYVFEFFIDDLLALLDHLRISKTILCGLSMGGYTALRAYERAPERIKGLILCDTRSEPDSNEAKLKRAAHLRTLQKDGTAAFAEGFLKAIFAPSSFKDQLGVVDQIRQTILNNPSLGIKGTLIALATRTDTTPVLATIRSPTLILVGDQDAVTPPSEAKAMQERINGSQLIVIPGAGHMSNMENPSAFNHALLGFLSGIRAH